MSTDSNVPCCSVQTDNIASVKHRSRLTRFIRYFSDDIGTKHVDLQLIILSFSTGIIDVVSSNDFSVFISIQTGNTVTLGIHTSTGSSASYLSICASLFTFLFAGFLSGQIGNLIGHQRRWWILFNMFFQTILIFIVVGLVSENVIKKDEDQKNI
ncbi:unnamed protein product [Adineta ricciae]|uniref:Uncharacterized protein n=1 Tax=Adineta ricciae TaxID=249248 RepID=A0A815MSX3_ADIRI|nr:unnamed protein product [Adineta ricciae]